MAQGAGESAAGPDPAQIQLDALRGAIEGVLELSDDLQGVPLQHLARLHALAVRGLIETSSATEAPKQLGDAAPGAAKDASAAKPRTAEANSALSRTRRAYILAMLAVEQAADRLDQTGEGALPSGELRAAAEKLYGEAFYLNLMNVDAPNMAPPQQ